MPPPTSNRKPVLSPPSGALPELLVPGVPVVLGSGAAVVSGLGVEAPVVGSDGPELLPSVIEFAEVTTPPHAVAEASHAQSTGVQDLDRMGQP
jgi:hypothetical protein